ncbi:MAG: ArsC/Spx/MgsR family protein [Pseudomonadota bacterium]
MAIILFYEKPGCINNTRQKVLLAAAGHTVQAKNLLTEKWTAERLQGFFGSLPVADWFNHSAPRVRDGLIWPHRLSGEEALALMLDEPLLIRRPLMEVDGQCRVGFDPAAVDAWIGLGQKAPEPGAPPEDLETCPRQTGRLHAASCQESRELSRERTPS